MNLVKGLTGVVVWRDYLRVGHGRNGIIGWLEIQLPKTEVSF